MNRGRKSILFLMNFVGGICTGVIKTDPKARKVRVFSGVKTLPRIAEGKAR